MGSQVLKLATTTAVVMKTIAVLSACLLGEAEPSADAHYLGHYGSAYGYGQLGYGYSHHNIYNGYGYGHSPYRSHYGYAHHQGKREAEPTAVAKASADAHYGSYGYGGYGYGHGYGYGGYGHGYGHGYYGHSSPTYGYSGNYHY